jgi:hypothetical protein
MCSFSVESGVGNCHRNIALMRLTTNVSTNWGGLYWRVRHNMDKSSHSVSTYTQIYGIARKAQQSTKITSHRVREAFEPNDWLIDVLAFGGMKNAQARQSVTYIKQTQCIK